MQIKVQEAKVLKTGTGKNGDWELIKVVSDDNTEYTTFDKKAKNTTGAVIEFDPIIKEGKLSFKDFKIVSEAPAGVTTSPQMTKEDWASKDLVQRTSIEAQVAFKGIIKLVAAGVLPLDDKLAMLAKDWASSRLTTKSPLMQSLPPATKEPVEELFSEDNKTTTLYDYIATNMNWKNSKSARTWIVNICKIAEDRIDSEPEIVKKEIAQLQGWTV